MPTTYYLISDLHIGGDGGLAQCQFENELERLLMKALPPIPPETFVG
jgi:hypothetical protein